MNQDKLGKQDKHKTEINCESLEHIRFRSNKLKTCQNQTIALKNLSNTAAKHCEQ